MDIVLTMCLGSEVDLEDHEVEFWSPRSNVSRFHNELQRSDPSSFPTDPPTRPKGWKGRETSVKLGP